MLGDRLLRGLLRERKIGIYLVYPKVSAIAVRAPRAKGRAEIICIITTTAIAAATATAT